MEILHRKFSTTAAKIRPRLCLALHPDFGMELEGLAGLGIDEISLTGRLKKFLEVDFTTKNFLENFFSLGLLGDQKSPSTGRTCKIPTFENSPQGSFKLSAFTLFYFETIA